MAQDNFLQQQSGFEARGHSSGRPHMAQGNFLQKRLVSLDAYRGLIMIALAFVGFGLARTATLHLNDKSATDSHAIWAEVHHQFEHAEWTGGGFWDLIQPSFMFMVGVSMAFSCAKRQEEGQSFLWMFGHAAFRAVVLIFLGIFLISSGQRITQWSFMNVLTQIGLGYIFLFLLWKTPPWVQALAAAFLLAGTWALYAGYPILQERLVDENWPAVGIDTQVGDKSVGITQAWAEKNLSDVPPAWHKNANVGHFIDKTILNWLPQRQPGRSNNPRNQVFRFNGGGYQTINFIPSLATMIFGLLAGQLLRSQYSGGQKLLFLVVAGLAGLALGQLLHQTNICPLIKRLWTPSWALYSTGWCLLILAALYGLIDVLGFKAWTFPLVVVGVNSIAIYCMTMLLAGWVAGTFRTHFGPSVFRSWIPTSPAFMRDFLAWLWGPSWEEVRQATLLQWAPTVQALLVGGVFWLICLWMYRRKIFLRI